MVELAERLLRPKDRQRRRIIWRLDAGFGSDDAVKWLLSRDYQILVKGYNTRRAKKVALDVEPDDWQAVRPDKWVATVPTNIRYGRRVETLALKWLAPKSGERYALLLHTLGQSAAEVVKLYDARGGAIESDIQQDKLGLQLLRRRKRSWHAQEAWVILSDLAHNLLIWSQDWMWADSRFESYGMLRLVQDVLSIPGSLEFKGDQLCKVSLQRTHPFATEVQSCLRRLFKELC
jgi:Transposase DDE domain group 1